MQTLTIRAGTLEVADELFVALDGFQPEMTPSAVGGYEVTVAIEENPEQLVSILKALQSYLTQRHEGAVIQLNGHRYAVEPNSPERAAKTDSTTGRPKKGGAKCAPSPSK